MKLDIEQLVEDLGGCREISKKLSIEKSIPYGWLRRDFLSSDYLSLIKKAYPSIKIDAYFTKKEEILKHGQKGYSTKRST